MGCPIISCGGGGQTAKRRTVGLKSDLERDVARVFRAQWSTRDGNVVPDDSDITLGNDAVKLEGTVLYADLADSTGMVASQTASVAAELYKSFLHCAAKIIRSEDGMLSAYDGDRVMAVYIGHMKNTRAGPSALKIHYAVLSIVNPAYKSVYTSGAHVLKHVVGI